MAKGLSPKLDRSDGSVSKTPVVLSYPLVVMDDDMLSTKGSISSSMVDKALNSAIDNRDDDTANAIIALKCELAEAKDKIEKLQSSRRFGKGITSLLSLDDEIEATLAVKEKKDMEKMLSGPRRDSICPSGRRDSSSSCGSIATRSMHSWTENLRSTASGGLGVMSRRSSCASRDPEQAQQERTVPPAPQPLVARHGCTACLDLGNLSGEMDERRLQLATDFALTARAILREAYGQDPDRDETWNDYVVLPTGTGAAICVVRPAPGDPSPEHSALWLSARMMAWAEREGIHLRCGLSGGFLETVRDVYSLPNVSGGVIDLAARITDCALPGQILACTETAVSLLENRSGDSGLWYNVDREKHEVIVKNSVTAMVQAITGTVTFGCDERMAFGTVDVPEKKWYLRLKPAELSYDEKTGLKGKVPPAELLRRHRRVAFVGVTHGQLAKVFSAVLEKEPKHCWDRIHILFLSDDRLEWIANERAETLEELRLSKSRARADLEELLSDHVHELHFLEYDRPFYCASYWDWDERGGFIHVSPLVWGANPKTCPAVNYHWIATEADDDYVAYQDGLSSLLATAHPI